MLIVLVDDCVVLILNNFHYHENIVRTLVYKNETITIVFLEVENVWFSYSLCWKLSNHCKLQLILFVFLVLVQKALVLGRKSTLGYWLLVSRYLFPVSKYIVWKNVCMWRLLVSRHEFPMWTYIACKIYVCVRIWACARGRPYVPFI